MTGSCLRRWVLALLLRRTGMRPRVRCGSRRLSTQPDKHFLFLFLFLCVQDQIWGHTQARPHSALLCSLACGLCGDTGPHSRVRSHLITSLSLPGDGHVEGEGREPRRQWMGSWDGRGEGCGLGSREWGDGGTAASGGTAWGLLRDHQALSGATSSGN